MCVAAPWTGGQGVGREEGGRSYHTLLSCYPGNPVIASWPQHPPSSTLLDSGHIRRLGYYIKDNAEPSPASTEIVLKCKSIG